MGQADLSGVESEYHVPLTGKGDVMVVLPLFPPNPKLRAEIVYQGPLKAPLKKGDQVAMLRVTTPNRAVSEAPLYVAEDVETGGILRRGVDTVAVMAGALGVRLIASRREVHFRLVKYRPSALICRTPSGNPHHIFRHLARVSDCTHRPGQPYVG